MLRVFIKEVQQLRLFCQQGKPFRLKSLAEHLIQEAAVNEDKLKARFACLSYTIYKQSSKEHLAKDPKYTMQQQKLLVLLDAAVDQLERHAFHDVFTTTSAMIKVLNDIDLELSHYADFTYKQAQVKMASIAYAAGMSLQQARFLTDADLKQTFHYVGATRMHDETPEPMGMAERLDRLKKAVGE